MAGQIVTTRFREGGAQLPAPEAELLEFGLRRLNRHGGKIDGFGHDAGRGAGFQSAQPESELIAQGIREEV